MSDTSLLLTGVVGEDHRYKTLAKGVKTPADMQLWEKSVAYSEYLGFIMSLNEAVIGKSNTMGCANISKNVEQIVLMLKKIDSMIEECPPIEQPQRFGNQAFRTWYQMVKERTLCLLKEAFPSSVHRAIPEVMYYIIDGFGNSIRIDYGTGHEISFLMFLCCLFKIGFFTEEDRNAVVCRIFPKYLQIVRKLQQTYRMEPAGSHGVWSLDDYQFVPFIWGSAQLVGHPKLDPASFLKEDVVEANSDNYLFMSCIQYINKVKTGPFAEHSNQLWGISGVSNWAKINSGLIRMYKVEVLSKFPVVQHIVFGSLLPLRAVEAPAPQRSTSTVLSTNASDNLEMSKPRSQSQQSNK